LNNSPGLILVRQISHKKPDRLSHWLDLYGKNFVFSPITVKIITYSF